MLPSACPNENQPRRFAAQPRYGLVVAAIALACSAAWGVESGGDAGESDWAAGTPVSAILDARPTDSTKRNVVTQVLERSLVPVVRERGPKLLDPTDGSVRLAQRPSANDGWRASGLHTSPLIIVPPNHSDGRATVPAQLPLTFNPPGTKPAASQSNTPAIKTESVESASNEAVEESSESAADEGSDSVANDGKESATTDHTDADITPIAEESGDDSSTEEPAGEESLDEATTDDATTDADSDVDAEEQPETSDEADGEVTAEPVVSVPQVEEPPLPPLTRSLVNLRRRVRSVLKGYYRKPLNSHDNNCWEVMHGMLSYGIHSRVLQGSRRGESITAVGWLCYNKPCKGMTLMYVTPQGELRAKWGVGLQGHTGQLLAMLAQCKVSPDYPIRIGKHEFTIHDLIEAEQKTCYPKSELTFKLLAFQQYLDLNERWVNDQGLDWDIPRLIREELSQPMRSAACGGTHRLSSLTLTVKVRQRRGEPLDGEYARAADFVEKYERYAFRLQNRDGSLSTEWFRGRGDEDDIDRRIKTTGHILEWLCYSLSDDQLRRPQTIRAVWYLSSLMYSNYDHDWEVGPRSHALHALLLYDERVFKPYDRADDMANNRPGRSTASRSRRSSSYRR